MITWFGGLKTGKKNSSQGKKLSPAPLSPRRATFLFLRRPKQLTPEEQADLLTLRQSHPEVNQTYELVQQFAQMLRTRTGEQLDMWLAKVAESRIPELQSFLLGIERDKSAVAAGLTLPHSIQKGPSLASRFTKVADDPFAMMYFLIII